MKTTIANFLKSESFLWMVVVLIMSMSIPTVAVMTYIEHIERVTPALKAMVVTCVVPFTVFCIALEWALVDGYKRFHN